MIVAVRLRHGEFAGAGARLIDLRGDGAERLRFSIVASRRKHVRIGERVCVEFDDATDARAADVVAIAENADPWLDAYLAEARRETADPRLPVGSAADVVMAETP